MSGGARVGGRYGAALRSRDLRLLLSASVVDAVGGWAMSVVLVVYVYERTGSAASITLTTACGWLPRLLLSVYAGAVADRLPRRRVMLGSALAALALTLALAGAVAGDLPVAVVLVLNALVASAATFYGPAAQAVVPASVPEKDLAAANALFGLTENLTVVVGPVVGGLVLLAGGATAAVLVNAGSFLLAAALVVRLRAGSAVEGEPPSGSLLSQITTGLSALRAEPVALALVGYTALDSAVYGAVSVLYVPLSEHLGTGTNGYTYLVSSMAVGGAVGALFVGRLEDLGRLAPVIAGGLCLEALPIALTAFTGARVPAAALQVVAGLGMVVVDVLAVTALQRDLPREVLSRVFGVLFTLALGGILLGSLVSNALLAVSDLRVTLLVVGLGISALALLSIGPLLAADRRAVATLAALRPKVALLEVLDLFDAAPRSTLERLARALVEERVEPGAVVVHEGDPADALYVVVSGELAVHARGEAGTDRQLRTLGARSYFGEIGLLRGLPRTATVEALEPTVLWRLSGDDFLGTLESARPSSSVLAVAGSRLSVTHPALATEPAVAP